MQEVTLNIFHHFSLALGVSRAISFRSGQKRTVPKIGIERPLY